MRLKAEVKGFEEFSRKLKDIAQRVEEIGETRIVPMGELFNDTFLKKYTDFTTFLAMKTTMKEAGFKVETQEDLDNIPKGALDPFVIQHSQFSTWQEMLNKAGVEWVQRQLTG